MRSRRPTDQGLQTWKLMRLVAGGPLRPSLRRVKSMHVAPWRSPHCPSVVDHFTVAATIHNLTSSRCCP